MATIDCAKVAAAIHRDMCDNDNNGYSQSPRNGEDGLGIRTLTIDGLKYEYDQGSYDCSSSICKAWQEAIKYTPYKGKLDGATYTGNMRSVFEKSGLFTSSNDWATRGDVYLNDVHHTAMCQSELKNGKYYFDGVVGKDMLSQFSINEKGTATGGKVGDQTGREAYVGPYYNYPWNKTLHYNGKANTTINTNTSSSSTSSSSKKSNEVIAKEVINGKWGNNPEREKKLKAAGYDANAIQKIVNQMLNGTYTAKKSNTEIAKEVIDGKWGNNPERAKKLKAAGYDADAVQKVVNQLLKASAADTNSGVDIEKLAQDVIAGKYGSGDERKKKLGSNYDAVQKRVNEILAGSNSSNTSPGAPSSSVEANHTLRGIDISYWNDKPFNATTETAFKESDFVIVKATQGTSKPNAYYDYDIKRVQDSGKLLGVYHYAEGTDPIAEADYFYNKIKDLIGNALPCLDWEKTQNESFGKDDNWCRKFVDRFHDLAGIYPLIYCGVYELSQVKNCYPDCKLWCPGYPKDENSWDIPKFPYKISPWEQYTIWQFTSGKNAVDRNTSPLTKDEWKQLCKPSK